MKATIVTTFGTLDKTATENFLSFASRLKTKNADVFFAFTSDFIQRKNPAVFSLDECLLKIISLKYDELHIVSLFMTAKGEFTKMKERINKYKTHFKNITFTKPLLEGSENIKKTSDIILKSAGLKNTDGILLAGHGSEDASNEEYVFLQNEFLKRGFLFTRSSLLKTSDKNFSIQESISFFKQNNIQCVNIIPVMILMGAHVKNEIYSDAPSSIESQLKNAGLQVKKCDVCFLENIDETYF